MSRNPARLHKWGCGTSINLSNFGLCISMFSGHDSARLGMINQKWAWSRNSHVRAFYFLLCPGLSCHRLSDHVHVPVDILYLRNIIMLGCACEQKAQYHCLRLWVELIGMTNKCFNFATLVGLAKWLFWSIIKPVFWQFWRICCAYESLRCLHLEI